MLYLAQSKTLKNWNETWCEYIVFIEILKTYYFEKEVK